jgi:hypothetical protein
MLAQSAVLAGREKQLLFGVERTGFKTWGLFELMLDWIREHALLRILVFSVFRGFLGRILELF